jgi:hypothetical protein
MLEVKDRHDGKRFAIVRLDTGWVTSYPLDMVHAERRD